MLDWMIYHLGGSSKGVYPLKVPGPNHSARWMSKYIYYAKLLACSKVFKMSDEEVNQAQSVTEFLVLFYGRPWFKSSLAAVAARSDLKFITNILRYYRLSQIWPLLQSCYRQLWYLTGQMILLALVDKDLSKEEREEIAWVLHQSLRKEKSKYGKPVFPVISCLLTPYPTPP